MVKCARCGKPTHRVQKITLEAAETYFLCASCGWRGDIK